VTGEGAPEATLVDPQVRPVVTLYTRKGCHLCAVVKGVLDQARGDRDFDLVILDIDDDPALVALYDTDVPVVTINGGKAFKYRVNPAELREHLDRVAADSPVTTDRSTIAR
jgi:glutaredoxin